MIKIYLALTAIAFIGAYGTRLVPSSFWPGVSLVMASSVLTGVLWIYVSKFQKNLVTLCASWDAVYAVAYTGFLYVLLREPLSISQIIGIALIAIGMVLLGH